MTQRQRRNRERTFEKSVVGQYVRRQERLEALGFKNYAEFLRSDLWAETKRKARASGMKHCLICGSAIGLNYHHNKYEIHREPRLDHLLPLCSWCHGEVHKVAHSEKYKYRAMRTAVRRVRRDVQGNTPLMAFLADPAEPEFLPTKAD